MIIVHTVSGREAKKHHLNPGDALPEGAVWIDLVEPTEAEENCIEKALNLDVPTREETLKNEVLNRTYVSEEATYMTALLTTKSDSEYPDTGAVILIHTEGCLITVRYDEIKSFNNFSKTLVAEPWRFGDGESVLEGLLSEFASRLADVCEHILTHLNLTSRLVFGNKEMVSSDAPLTSRDYDKILKVLGRRADHVAKIHESLHSLLRAMLYFQQVRNEELKYPPQVKRLQSDFQALGEETAFLSTKIGFLLEATLGLINLQQNMIIKIFSVAAVMLMPATLVASVYGMNFKHMPELESVYGYPLALCAMVMSAILPYLYFKHRKWL